MPTDIICVHLNTWPSAPLIQLVRCQGMTRPTKWGVPGGDCGWSVLITLSIVLWTHDTATDTAGHCSSIYTMSWDHQ